MPGAPRTDPYVKDYFIRLLPWVADDQSLVGIRMENPGVGKPAPRQTANPFPGPSASFLAPPTQDATPESLDLSTKCVETAEVAGDRVVVEPPLDHGSKPSPSWHTDSELMSFLASL